MIKNRSGDTGNNPRACKKVSSKPVNSYRPFKKATKIKFKESEKHEKSQKTEKSRINYHSRSVNFLKK